MLLTGIVALFLLACATPYASTSSFPPARPAKIRVAFLARVRLLRPVRAFGEGRVRHGQNMVRSAGKEAHHHGPCSGGAG